MHDARAMQQVTSIRSNMQVRYNIHPSNLISPTHVFNGEFLFLGLLVWFLLSTGDNETDVYKKTLETPQTSSESLNKAKVHLNGP